MDQERDTTENAESSRRGRLWLENGPPSRRPGNRTRQTSATSKEFAEITRETAARLDQTIEPLPTLFELPDKTPEGLKRHRESSQFRVHNVHEGPPASHVDPPSGNESQRSHANPPAPAGTGHAAPERVVSGPHFDSGRPSTSGTAPAQQVAAYDTEKPMSWAEDSKASWRTRSTMIVLMLMMVTLAYFSGRGFEPTESPGESLLADVDAADLEDTIVVITEDLPAADDRFATTGEETRIAEFETSNESQSVTTERTNEEILSEIADLSAEYFEDTQTNLLPDPTVQLPSYIADAPLPGTASGTLGTTLGTPSISGSNDTIASQTAVNESAQLAGDNLTMQPQSVDAPAAPPLLGSNESIVAYRTDSELGNEDPGVSESLPSGMDSRLRLENGLRYSDTPHVIGNFLEILKAWEASVQQ